MAGVAARDCGFSLSMQKLSLENYLETNEWCGLVQELCEGGELEKSLGKSHYSERTVRSIDLFHRLLKYSSEQEVVIHIDQAWSTH